MNQPRVANYYTFDPDIVSKYLLQNDWAGCWAYLADILDSLSLARNFGLSIMLQSDLEHDASRQKILQFGQLLGELIGALLADPQSRLPDKSFVNLICQHEILHDLFYLFGANSFAQTVSNILNNNKNLSETQQKKILLLLSLREEMDIVSILKKVDTKYRFAAVASYLSYTSVSDNNIYQNKIKLYALRYELDKSFSEVQALSSAVMAYFNCSYLDIPHRHQIKENINKSVQRLLQIKSRDFKRSRPCVTENIQHVQGLPHIVVHMEFLYEEHAMTRSWGEFINSLKSQFAVTILVASNKSTPNTSDVFENVIRYENLGDLVDKCNQLTPDILFLPSVGMTFFGVVSANMRVAPIQIMGLGHPACAMSPFIDYVYGPEELYHPDAFANETYVIDNSPYKFIPVLSKEDVLAIQPFHRMSGDKTALRVSVVGTKLKLTAPFVQILKEIESESSFPIQFTFHIGSAGLDTLSLQKYLESQLKNVSYSGFKSYRDYMESMKDCDIVLNPIPFGHTNTLIDTMLLGKPCVSFHGAEPSSATEMYILKILGLERNFTVTNPEEYKQKFFDLTQQIYDGTLARIDREQVYDKLYGNDKKFDFGEVFKWIYDHHAEIKARSQKSVKVFSSFED